MNGWVKNKTVFIDGLCLPVCIVMLKVSVLYWECQNGGVVVEAKIIISAFYSLNLLWSKLRQPTEFSQMKKNIRVSTILFRHNILCVLRVSIPRFWQTSSNTALPNHCLHHFIVVSIINGISKPADVKLFREREELLVVKAKQTLNKTGQSVSCR